MRPSGVPEICVKKDKLSGSSGTGIYHVMLRGINRQDIFDDTEDYCSQCV